jgi:CheW-like domain
MIGSPRDTVPPRPAPQERYVIVTLGELRLLLPQHQIYTLEAALDVERPEGEEQRGWISIDGASWPVYCLSADLRPLREVPPARRICLLLRIDDSLLGLLCDGVTLYGGQGEPRILPLPGCMQAPNTPLRGLALQGEEVLCLTCAEELRACADPGRSPATPASAGQRPECPP